VVIRVVLGRGGRLGFRGAASFAAVFAVLADFVFLGEGVFEDVEVAGFPFPEGGGARADGAFAHAGKLLPLAVTPGGGVFDGAAVFLSGTEAEEAEPCRAFGVGREDELGGVKDRGVEV
jgi:hypothetical protein